nr:hypothetical protein [Acinetobacter sp. Marseille-Q1620]
MKLVGNAGVMIGNAPVAGLSALTGNYDVIYTIYDGEWNLAGDQLKYDKSTGKYTRFNKIAIDALAKQIKEIYLD